MAEGYPLIWILGFLIFSGLALPLYLSALLCLPHPGNWLRYSRKKPQEGKPVRLGDSPGTFQGRFYQGPKDWEEVLILCHGRSRSMGHVEPLALALRQGVSVLTFDFQGHGLRGFGPTTLGLKESQDVDKALDLARRMGAKRILAVGMSMGCAALALSLARRRQKAFSGLALVGPYQSLERLIRLRAPWAWRIPPLMAAVAWCCRVFWSLDLQQVDLSKSLDRAGYPLALYWGHHDSLTGEPHARALMESLAFETTQSYLGDHDVPENPQLQSLLKDWCARTLSSS